MYNLATLAGHLGKDPILKTTPAGNEVCNFSVATSKSWKDKAGNWKDKTEWHNIVAWGKLANYCATKFKKGSRVLLSGEIETRSWEKDNIKRYMTEIILKDIKSLDKSQSSNTPQAQANINANNQQISISNEFTDDNIPF